MAYADWYNKNQQAFADAQAQQEMQSGGYIVPPTQRQRWLGGLQPGDQGFGQRLKADIAGRDMQLARDPNMSQGMGDLFMQQQQSQNNTQWRLHQIAQDPNLTPEQKQAAMAKAQQNFDSGTQRFQTAMQGFQPPPPPPRYGQQGPQQPGPPPGPQPGMMYPGGDPYWRERMGAGRPFNNPELTAQEQQAAQQTAQQTWMARLQGGMMVNQPGTVQAQEQQAQPAGPGVGGPAQPVPPAPAPAPMKGSNWTQAQYDKNYAAAQARGPLNAHQQAWWAARPRPPVASQTNLIPNQQPGTTTNR